MSCDGRPGRPSRSRFLCRRGGNAANMWGPPGGPDWIVHDPSKNAAKLSGVAIYAAASTGAVGAVDNLPPDFPTPSAVRLWRASRWIARSSSPTPRGPLVFRSRSWSGRRVRTPGACSNRRCTSRGTPSSVPRWERIDGQRSGRQTPSSGGAVLCRDRRDNPAGRQYQSSDGERRCVSADGGVAGRARLDRCSCELRQDFSRFGEPRQSIVTVIATGK